MNLTLIFSFIFACLVITCQSTISPSTDATTNEATTVDATVAGLTSTVESSATATTESSGTAESQGPTQTPGTTESPGPTNSPGPTESTLAPASQGSSQNPPLQTTVPPVVPTTEAPLTTQADVWAEFDLDCNSTANYCIYKINAPQLDASKYNEDNSKLQTDKNLYLGASSKLYFDSSSFFANKVYQSYQDAQEMVKNLTMQMQILRDTVDQALAEAQNQTASISDAYSNIKAIYSNLTTCYYQKCALVTPPPITTTTTSRPTTPNICSDHSCNYPGGQYQNGSCLVVSGKPICQCPGNLDQKNDCAKVSCYSSLTGLSDGKVPGPLWSPGYTSGSTSASYVSKQNCLYKITSKNPLKIVVNNYNLDSTVNFLVNGKAIPPTQKDKTKMQNYVDGIIKNSTTSLTITFKTTNVPTTGGPYFFDWDVVDY